LQEKNPREKHRSKRGFLMPRRWPDQKSMAGPMFIYRYPKNERNMRGRFFRWRISSWRYSFVLVDVATKNNLSRLYVITAKYGLSRKNLHVPILLCRAAAREILEGGCA
jgi:hypothetical protein